MTRQRGGKRSRDVGTPPPARRLIVLAACLIVLATIAAYRYSFAGPFLYDDDNAIVDNPTIRQLWPIWQVLSPPRRGETVSGRPLLNLSLAVNYALGGFEVWGYHATNLLIHVAAALLLMGILRRTFLLPRLRERFGRAALVLASASAILWAVHPLQTEAVTYIVQRAESLMGCCYLLTLYCVIRGDPRDDPHRPAWPWNAAAVLACLAGTACKEVMITAPLMVLLYDRTFLAGSFHGAWRQRRTLYLGLAAAWILAVYLVFSTGLMARRPEMAATGAWGYACSQPGVILHYLRLSLWPYPLCFDYAWPVADTLGEILPGTIAVGLLLAATVWGLTRRTAWGFLGAWFLLILAPTSSILPLGQLAAEHRMYLSLAAVVVLAVAGVYALWDKWLLRAAQGGQSLFSPGWALGKVGLRATKKGTVPGWAAAVRWAPPAVVWSAVAIALGCVTVARNWDYRSLVTIWQDTVDKRPDSYVAHDSLGSALAAAGRTEEAIEHFQRALRLKGDDPLTHNNLGLALATVDRWDEAIEHYHEALRLKADFADAHENLASALASVGRIREAVEHYDEALREMPDSITTLNNAAWLLATHEPDQGGDPGRAIRLAQRVRELSGEETAFALDTLAAAYAAAGRFSEAVAAAQRAVELAESARQVSAAKLIRARLELYRNGRPYRETPRPAAQRDHQRGLPDRQDPEGTGGKRPSHRTSFGCRQAAWQAA